MSLVLAADYRVPDFDHWWNRLRRDLPRLPSLGAHHIVVYRAIRDADHVFVTIGVHEREPIDALLRSPVLFSWFDSAGVTEIPPLFAGQIVEKIDLSTPPTPTASQAQAAPGPVGDPAGVVVASIVSVGEVEKLCASVHRAVARITASGVRRFWIYRALDDGAEAMILQELATERLANQWIRHPDASARFMAEAGVGAHPPNFVGRLAQILEVPAGPLGRD
jgi:hypothetical protein